MNTLYKVQPIKVFTSALIFLLVCSAIYFGISWPLAAHATHPCVIGENNETRESCYHLDNDGQPYYLKKGGDNGAGLQDVKQDAKLQACQAIENSIKNRSLGLVSLAKNIESKFDAIAKKVQDFYMNVVVASGGVVAGYDALTSDIQVKKSAVETALAKAQNDATVFSCPSENLKEKMMQFKNDMQTVKQALQDYRTSIKNLIVAIISMLGENNNAQ